MVTRGDGGGNDGSDVPGNFPTPSSVPARSRAAAPARAPKYAFGLVLGACFSSLACTGAAPNDDVGQCGDGECSDGTGGVAGASSTGEDAAGSTSDSVSGSDTSDTAADSDTGETGDSPLGCATDASGVAISVASLYQVIEIPIVDKCAPIPVADRASTVVAGREGVVRATLQLAPSWEATDVAVQVELQSGDETASYASPCTTVDGGTPSVDLLVDLPGDAIERNQQVSLSVVACGDTEALARTPSGDLGAESTGVIRIHMVPFEVGGFVPDTSPAVLDGFRDAVLAMYPVHDVEITVGEVEPDPSGGPLDMDELMFRLIQLQEELVFASGDLDPAVADIYYYGLVSGAETREEFCASCPTGTSESGVGERAGSAVGAAFADALSESTLVHELGHMHGLTHSPCGDPNLQDEDFPYEDGLTHTEGWDFRTREFIPVDHHDVMGYCQPRWVSDYSYNKMVQWVHLAASWGG